MTHGMPTTPVYAVHPGPQGDTQPADGGPGAGHVWYGMRKLEQLAMLSQISQAEAKKFFIEQTRLKKWRRTGIIWWNMLDCWPQISDAVVDYYFHKKLAFYYIGRVQQPVCMVCRRAGELVP